MSQIQEDTWNTINIFIFKRQHSQAVKRQKYFHDVGIGKIF